MTGSKWRLLLSLVSLFAILSVAVACGDDDDEGDGGASGDGTSSATSAATTPASSVQKGGTITIGALQYESWDPHFGDFAQDIAHYFKVWRGLYELDLDNKPVPAMASRRAMEVWV